MKNLILILTLSLSSMAFAGPGNGSGSFGPHPIQFLNPWTIEIPPRDVLSAMADSGEILERDELVRHFGNPVTGKIQIDLTKRDLIDIEFNNADVIEIDWEILRDWAALNP
jgi:hypothetical protein